MLTVTMNTKTPVDQNTLLSLNKTTGGVISTHTASPADNTTPIRPARQIPPSGKTPKPSPSQPAHRIPPLLKPVQKGQKLSIETASPLGGIKVCFGWNTVNPACDVDVSAFLLGADGKVTGDSWFVFYGQAKSPDQSVVFYPDSSADREYFDIDFHKLNPSVHKIVFVLTIHEALARRLHFGMLKDAYIRILTENGKTELASFQMKEYYTNVISMMIGEVYRHNGIWKFHAVGNGVARDLAGLCELYGVQISD